MTNHHFDEMAQQQGHWWFLGRQKVIQAAFRPFCDLQKVDISHPLLKIADVGCGTGENTNLLNNLPRAEAIGIEMDDHARRLAAQQFPSVRFLPGQALQLPLQTSSMDWICNFDVLEHLPDDAAALEESWRCLRPGGGIFITVPAYQWLWSSHDEALAHYRRYSQTELLEKLGTRGFQTIYCTHFVTGLFPMISTATLLEIILRRPIASSSSGTHLRTLPAWANRMGAAIMAMEAFGIKRRIRFPFGSSLLILARKPAAG